MCSVNTKEVTRRCSVKQVFWRYVPPGKFDLFWTAIAPVKNRLFRCYFFTFLGNTHMFWCNSTFLGNTHLFWCNSTFLGKTHLFWSYTTCEFYLFWENFQILASWEKRSCSGNSWAALEMERHPGQNVAVLRTAPSREIHRCSLIIRESELFKFSKKLFIPELLQFKDSLRILIKTGTSQPVMSL